MMSRTLQWGMIVSTLVLIIGVWLVSKNAASLQQEIHAKLENKFGFTSEVVSIETDGEEVGFLSISPRENGLMFAAGFRDGDIVLSHTKFKFYSLLYRENGSTVPIEIIRGKDASSNEEKLHLKIFFEIPN